MMWVWDFPFFVFSLIYHQQELPQRNPGFFFEQRWIFGYSFVSCITGSAAYQVNISKIPKVFTTATYIQFDVSCECL